MNWKVNNFQVPNHPNWTGKAYRSSEEAFKGRRFGEPPARPSFGWGGIILGIVLVLVTLIGFIPRDSQASTTDYAQRSLNKTIVVNKGNTSTRYESSGGTQVETHKSDRRQKTSKKP